MWCVCALCLLHAFLRLRGDSFTQCYVRVRSGHCPVKLLLLYLHGSGIALTFVDTLVDLLPLVHHLLNILLHVFVVAAPQFEPFRNADQLLQRFVASAVGLGDGSQLLAEAFDVSSHDLTRCVHLIESHGEICCALLLVLNVVAQR